jgi:oligopeptide transport system ATP-binding protein
MNRETLLQVENMAFSFHTYAGEVQAVRGVDFTINKGETLGIVGESGCGKSVTAKSIIQLNPIYPAGELKSGRIVFDGTDLATLDTKEISKVRAKEIRMIFQDPMTSLNPTMKVGKQIQEGILKAEKISKDEAKKRSIEMLRMVKLPSPEERYNQYPHEFSGGMRQRAMIALAMAVNPKLLIADEPTTALDVTTQAQILNLMKRIQKEYETTIILITHDLGVVANIAKNIAVMYAGKVIEYGTADEIFETPAHPYTWGLLKSVPDLDSDVRERLESIKGTPPDLFNPPIGCPFAARCSKAMKICHRQEPESTQLSEDHRVSCWLYHEQAPAAINPFTMKAARLKEARG